MGEGEKRFRREEGKKEKGKKRRTICDTWRGEVGNR